VSKHKKKPLKDKQPITPIPSTYAEDAVKSYDAAVADGATNLIDPRLVSTLPPVTNKDVKLFRVVDPNTGNIVETNTVPMARQGKAWVHGLNGTLVEIDNVVHVHTDFCEESKTLEGIQRLCNEAPLERQDSGVAFDYENVPVDYTKKIDVYDLPEEIQPTAENLFDTYLDTPRTRVEIANEFAKTITHTPSGPHIKSITESAKEQLEAEHIARIEKYHKETLQEITATLDESDYPEWLPLDHYSSKRYATSSANAAYSQLIGVPEWQHLPDKFRQRFTNVAALILEGKEPHNVSRPFANAVIAYIKQLFPNGL
jgi:hypothetical protein